MVYDISSRPINILFLTGPTPASFSLIFGLFQTNIITIFTTNISEKCPSCIWCQDSNPQPLELESLPITTRTGLPKNILCNIGRTKIQSKLDRHSRSEKMQNSSVMMFAESRTSFLTCVSISSFGMVQSREHLLLGEGSLHSWSKSYKYFTVYILC